MLPITKTADINTWMALLLSKDNPDRPATACDTRFESYAITSFLSDMSSGFSGNMGFKMPANWTYDQFSEIPMGTDWAIDKDAYVLAMNLVVIQAVLKLVKYYRRRLAYASFAKKSR